MPASPIKFKDRKLRLYKCIKDPEFGMKTILADDPFDYVEMWLKRKKHDRALCHWQQAEEFANASRDLPNYSAPLTHYYAAENAVEALLLVSGGTLVPAHGVTGENTTQAITLADEIVHIGTAGIFSGLCTYLGEAVQAASYSLEDIFYNLVYIHRAYTVTFPAKPELFVPITDAHFVRIDGSNKSFFRCEVPDEVFQQPQILASLPGWEEDKGVSTDKEFIIRRTKRFDWTGPDATSWCNFKRYYHGIRKASHYITGRVRLWYLKMPSQGPNTIDRSPLTLTLMALHRLSEMARYRPDLLEKHLESEHNWLLAQFIERSLTQFLEQIAAEITKHEFMPPGYAVR